MFKFKLYAICIKALFRKEFLVILPKFLKVIYEHIV